MSDTQRDTILVLHNPRSGSRHALDVIEALITKLRQSGFDAEDHDSLDTFQQRAEQLTASNRLRAVVAAGGDGTAAAVATRLSSATPLWLCPLGTENLLALYLGMTSDPDRAVASIIRLKTRSLDAGLANGRLFLIMVGVGFDAEVVRQVHTQRRGHIRRWHYWLPILRTAFRYRFPLLRLTEVHPTFDKLESAVGLEHEHSTPQTGHGSSIEAAWYFLLNLPRYAAGLDIAPDARGDDGRIDICAFKRGGLLRGLIYFAKLRFGGHRRLADFSHRTSAEFRIESVSSEEADVSYQLDGDWGGYLPLEIECLPGRLRVIEPLGETGTGPVIARFMAAITGPVPVFSSNENGQ